MVSKAKQKSPKSAPPKPLDKVPRNYLLIIVAVIGLLAILLLLPPASPDDDDIPGQPFCGDGICSLEETCETCPEDCGECQETDLLNQTGLILPTLDCSGMTGGEAYLLAINSSNLLMCACVDDEGMRENCKSVVSGKKNYLKAVETYDLALCDQVTNPFGAESCKEIVTEAISKYMETSPEQFIFTFLGAENFEEAVPLLEGLLEDDPDDFMALVILSTIYSDWAWSEGSSQEYSTRAIELADRALVLSPGSATLYRLKGYVYEASGDLNESFKSYNKAIELDPDYIPAYIGLGHAFRVSGALPTALRYFEEAKDLDVNVEYPTIYANLCTLQYSNYDYITQAVENCLIVTESDRSPDSLKAMAYGVLGNIYSDFGRFDEARYSFESALMYNPRDDQIYVLLAINENRIEDYIKAEEYAKESIALNPGKAIAYWHLAYSLYKQGDLDTAIENALLSLELIDTDATLLIAQKEGNRQEVYMLLMEIYKEKGDSANEEKYRNMLESA
jgi:tetratricopeptide (TPR) repeat protein